MTNQEILEQDPKFFDRADAHIHLSNSQIEGVNHGKVSASMMYATARFNAYVCWTGFDNKAEFAKARNEAVDYFVEQYQMMLEENLDDYVNNFDRSRQTPGGTHPDDSS